MVHSKSSSRFHDLKNVTEECQEMLLLPFVFLIRIAWKTLKFKLRLVEIIQKLK